MFQEVKMSFTKLFLFFPCRKMLLLLHSLNKKKLKGFFYNYAPPPTIPTPCLVEVKWMLKIYIENVNNLNLISFTGISVIFSQSDSLTQYMVLSVRLPACPSVPVSLLSKRPSSYCLIHFGGTTGAALG